MWGETDWLSITNCWESPHTANTANTPNTPNTANTPNTPKSAILSHLEDVNRIISTRAKLIRHLEQAKAPFLLANPGSKYFCLPTYNWSQSLFYFIHIIR